MKNVFSSDFRSTYSRDYLKSSIPLHSSPIYLQENIYPLESLEKHLSSLTSQPRPQESQGLTCICPNHQSQDNHMQMYRIEKKNQHLQKKIQSMRKMLESQGNKIDKIIKYKECHEVCGADCYKKKYLELLKNTIPH